MLRIARNIKWLAVARGPVAQLVRAPALQAGGQEFESPQVHHPTSP